MESMDLWNMFSTDFVEGDGSINDKIPENDGQTELERHQVKQEILEEDEGEDGNVNDNEDNENDEADEGDENERTQDNAGNGTNTGEPGDDAIFNFELKAINKDERLNIRTMNVPNMPNLRPTPSQINATDELGRPINYELGVIYICPACGSEYSAQDKWKAHMNQVHQYNTRRGLNFVRVDKLYHRCLECRKNIAMHSMENLLKHKFTHLPHRCVKCSICMRQYKYRQDLMVHLRMLHRDDVVVMMRDGVNNGEGSTSTRHYSQPKSYGGAGVNNLSITNVKENAIDMFDADDCIEVRNEPEMDADSEDIDQVAQVGFGLRSMFEDDGSRSSSQTSGRRARDGDASNDAAPSGCNSLIGQSGGKEEVCEDYIHYICPQCGTECETQGQWSQHIEFVHDFMSRRGLNFQILNPQQAQCMQCNKIVEPNSIKTLQSHKFGHLPHNEWMRCKLCYKGFKYPKAIQNHLLQQHHLDSLITDEGSQTDMDTAGGGDDDHTLDDPSMNNGRVRGEDKYEPHIDYLCPQCGQEFFEKKLWRNHVMKTHRMNDLSTLNFKVLNDRQLMCKECDKIITNAYGIQNAQQHRITHLPYKAFARCRICRKSYTDRKGLVKHIATRHQIGCDTSVVSGVEGVQNKSLQPYQRDYSEKKPNIKPKTVEPRRQIVTVKNQVYEIIYLDEDNDDDLDGNVDDNDDNTLLNESVTSCIDEDSVSSKSRYKCVDCGSLFPTQSSLQSHIKEEHEFVDYNQPNANSTIVPDERSSTPPLRKTSSDNVITPNAGSVTSVAENNFIFLCPSCGKEYKTQFDWRRHINEAHNFDKRQFLNMRQVDKFRYQCIQCKDIVCNPKLKGLQDHHFRHLTYRLYLKCLICGTCYNHKPNMMHHLRARHNIYEVIGDGDYAQPYQQTPAVTGTDLAGRLPKQRLLDSTVTTTRPPGLNTVEDNISYHNAVDLDFITYFCPKCNMNFDSHAFWRKHIVEEHNYNSREGLNFRQIDIHHYLCLECYIRVKVTHTKGAIGQLQSHKFRHLPYRSFKCLTCTGEFVRKQMFFKHLNRVTNRCDNSINNAEATNTENTDETATTQESGTNLADPDIPMEADNDNDDDDENMPSMNNTATTESKANDQLCPQCGANLDESYQCRVCKEKLGVKQREAVEIEPAPDSDNSNTEPNYEDVDGDIDGQVNNELEGVIDANIDADSNSSRAYLPPIPPHLLDDDIDFDEQYLLG